MSHHVATRSAIQTNDDALSEHNIRKNFYSHLFVWHFWSQHDVTRLHRVNSKPAFSYIKHCLIFYKPWSIETYNQGFIQYSFIGGGETRASASSAISTLLYVVEMWSFLIKCIDEKTKQLSSENVMLYITIS